MHVELLPGPTSTPHARRVLKKNPELIEEFVDRAAALLHDKNQGVALSGVTLMLHITSLEPGAVEHYRAHVPTLCKMLRNLLQVWRLVLLGFLGAVWEVGRANRDKQAMWVLCKMSCDSRGHLSTSLGLSTCQLCLYACCSPAAGSVLLLLTLPSHCCCCCCCCFASRVASTQSMMWAALQTLTCRSRSCSC
jgi:hypothetical protein